MKTWILAVLCACLWVWPGVARAQSGVPDRVAVLTMGPGDHPFARFGHNAIVLEWQGERLALVYNFGTFAFDGLQGVQDFMAGRFRYWLSVSTLPRTLRAYAEQNRTVVAQELDLTFEERARLAEALSTNALPENRFYDYDYYYDNCSTRVRDAIDRVLGGVLEKETRGPGRLTFRQHTLRLTSEAFWVSLGLDLALGPLTDRATTRWDETFIPVELQTALSRVQRERDGKRHPLVREERVLVTADRAPEPENPPARVLGFALIGLAMGLLAAAMGRAGQRIRTVRIGFVSMSALIGFVLGLLGIIFVVFWGFTKHWSAYRNLNLLLCTPWSIALVGTAIGVLRNKASAKNLHHTLLTLSAASALLAALTALIPGFPQDNTRIAALLAPLWMGLYVGFAWLESRPLVPQILRPQSKLSVEQEQ